MRVLVCGSRDWADEDVIADRLADLPANTQILHGAARGVDQIAANIADLYGLEVFAFPADWAVHGRRAGIMRNLVMLDEHPDLVLAFQRDGSRGTQHTIDEARRRRIPVEVRTTDDAQLGLPPSVGEPA